MVSGHSTQGTPIPQRGHQKRREEQQASQKSGYTCTTRAEAMWSSRPQDPTNGSFQD